MRVEYGACSITPCTVCAGSDSLAAGVIAVEETGFQLHLCKRHAKELVNRLSCCMRLLEIKEYNVVVDGDQRLVCTEKCKGATVSLRNASEHPPEDGIGGALLIRRRD